MSKKQINNKIVAMQENDLQEIKSFMLEIKESLSSIVASQEKLLSPAEACRMLGISRNTYQRYVRDKAFTQIRIGKSKNSRVYVRLSEIERLINEGKI